MKHPFKQVAAIVRGILFIYCTSTSFNTSQAQTRDSTQAATPVHLSTEEWKSLEGYFQSAANKDLYVKFTAKNDTLLGKLLWNNNLVHLLPSAPLHFTSIEAEDHGPIHVDFKDSAGEISQANVVDNGIWNRVKNYTPVVKKIMPHTAAQLKPFEGLYQLVNDSTRFIQFLEKENQLLLKQHWDGNIIAFSPETALDFFSEQVPQFALTFVKNQQGNIEEAIAFKRDKWTKIKKTTPSLQELRSYEGKYQFKDDADNIIQLTVKGNNLIVRQLWDAKEIVVEPMTRSYFYNNANAYPLLVEKDKDGKVLQVQTLNANVFEKIK